MATKNPSTPRDDAEWFRLWFHFLRVSPSYELARRHRTGTLPDDADLPADFETVLAVYDGLGDVRVLRVHQWWRSVAIHQFGYEADKPALTRLGVLSHDDDDDALMRIRSSVRDYLQEEWLDQIQPTSIIAAIPIGLPKAQIMKQLSAMIDGIVGEEKSLKRQLAGQKAPFKLRPTKLRYASAANYLLCLQIRSKEPEWTNWQVGVAANLSVHSNLIKKSDDGKGTAAEREALKMLTSRALYRAHMLAENAARGVFPSYAACEHAMPVDYPFIYRDRFGLFGQGSKK